MVETVLVGLVFLVLAGREAYRDLDGFIDFVFMSIFTCIIGGIGLAVGAALALGVGTTLPKEWAKTSEVKLVNLRDHTGVSGNFFLGTGSIGTSEYYFYYKEVPGGFSPGKVKIGNDVLVSEEERKDGIMQTFTHRFSNTAHYWFALHLSGDAYQFHIPKGTLKRGFSLGN